MNPLLWLLGGGIGLGLLASSGKPSPRVAPPAAPSSPSSSGKGPVAFSKTSIDQAIAVAMAHEQNPANLQSFAGALLVYGWTSQGSAMLARAAQLQAQKVAAAAKAAHVPSTPSHHTSSPHTAPHHTSPVPWSTHYTKAQLQSLIAQTQHDLTGGGGFGAATGAQKAQLEARLSHYKALLSALDHHASHASHASQGHH